MKYVKLFLTGLIALSSFSSGRPQKIEVETVIDESIVPVQSTSGRCALLPLILLERENLPVELVCPIVVLSLINCSNPDEVKTLLEQNILPGMTQLVRICPQKYLKLLFNLVCDCDESINFIKGLSDEQCCWLSDVIIQDKIDRHDYRTELQGETPGVDWPAIEVAPVWVKSWEKYKTETDLEKKMLMQKDIQSGVLSSIGYKCTDYFESNEQKHNFSMLFILLKNGVHFKVSKKTGDQAVKLSC